MAANRGLDVERRLGTTRAKPTLPPSGYVTVSATSGACLGHTPPEGGGPGNWEVQEGGEYTMTVTDVPECTGASIKVFIQGSKTGNFCLVASGGSGTYTTGPFTMPSPACYTYPISYKCDAGATCDNADTYNARYLVDGIEGKAVHLRASSFDAECTTWLGEDKCCTTCDDKDCATYTCTDFQCTDHITPHGAVCRAAANECDIVEVCDGINADCPADVYADAGTECDNGAYNCEDVAHCCVVHDTCDGAGNCDDNFKTSGTVCRSKAFECDKEDVCDGSTAECPDEWEQANTLCRPAAEGRACDVADYCTSDSPPQCPDNKKACGEPCSVPKDLCDLPEFCDGESIDCPTVDNRFPDACCDTCEGVNLCLPDPCPPSP